MKAHYDFANMKSEKNPYTAPLTGHMPPRGKGDVERTPTETPMQAGRCDCGYNFAKGHIDGSLQESYVVIRNEDYLRVMKKEHLLSLESRRKRRLKMVAESSAWVGTLMACPKCGAFLLLKPQGAGDDDEMFLLKKVHSDAHA